MKEEKIEVSKNDLQVLIDERFNHKLRNDKTIIHFSGMEQIINDMKTEQALMKKDLEYTKQGIDDIKNSLNGLGDIFATKVEHQTNRDSLDKLWKIVWAVIGFVFFAIGGAFLALILK